MTESEPQDRQEPEQDREIASTRVFNAPRALVWRAWSEPAHLMHWWGPNGFTNTFHRFDFRPGGAWRFVMHGPDGKNYENENVFVEIVEHELIVIDHQSWPRFRATVRFEDLDGQTKVTFRQLFESAQVYESVRPFAVPGHEQNLDRLAAHVATMGGEARDLVITRVFEAPSRLVWRAWTDPGHLALWWGPRGFSAPVCEIDLRVGGALRIVMRGPDGKEYPMRGVFREIVEPERLVFSNIPVDPQDSPLVEGLTSVTFVERQDEGQVARTQMTLHTRAVALVPHAAQMLAGMEAGWTQTIDRLLELLAQEA